MNPCSLFHSGLGALRGQRAGRPATVIALGLVLFATALRTSAAQAESQIEVGIGVRDITPQGPVWLAGYAARNRASEKVDSPLMAEAIAFQGAGGERVVFVSVDNCEVSREFTRTVLDEASKRYGLGPGRVVIVSSHTHSGPVLEGPLMTMYHFSETEHERVARYGIFLQERLVDAIGAALDDLKPATLETGVGRATFAMNRRVYQDDKVVFGENQDGPVDWEVHVLQIKGTNNAVRAILFGYACHGTSIAGDDFYIVSGDYMAYARQQLEALFPGTVAAYLTGMGADSNPSPRGKLLDAKRHGLELAGAVAGVLDRPMTPVAGPLAFAYAEVDLPLAEAPNREQIEKDAHSSDPNVQKRAQNCLAILDRGEALPRSVKLPLASVRFGNDLTFALMGGEVVVDYNRRLKRLLAADHPWLVGYAYEVPCYIPSIRILKEGGYEADSSLIYYGIYGPFRTQIEDILVNKMVELARSSKAALR